MTPSYAVLASPNTVTVPAVPGDIRASLVERISKAKGISIDLATLALDNTLIFLRGIAEHPGVALSPSKLVDEGWHQFILFTRNYADYCLALAGRFIHHRPTTEGSRNPQANSPHATYEFLQKHGLAPDRCVWLDSAQWGTCDGGCDGGGGGGDSCDGGCDGN